MSVITGRRLNRFWQKGIKPLKDLLGNHDIEDLSEDGTVTGALSKLNTDFTENVQDQTNAATDIQQHWAALYNNNGSTKTCYLKYEFRNGDKGTIYVTATRSGTINGLRKYTIIRGEALARIRWRWLEWRAVAERWRIPINRNRCLHSCAD